MCTTDMRRGSPQKGNEWQFAYSQDVRCKSRYCHSKILLSLRLKPCELFAAYFGPSQFWFVLSPLSSSPSQSFKASKHKVFRFLSWRFPRCCPCVCGALTSQGRTAIQETILAQRCLCMILLRRILLALDSSSSPLKLRERPLINPWLFPAPWISTQTCSSRGSVIGRCICFWHSQLPGVAGSDTDGSMSSHETLQGAVEDSLSPRCPLYECIECVQLLRPQAACGRSCPGPSCCCRRHRPWLSHVKNC